MGLYKDSRGVNCFSPDNTDTSFYVAYSASVADILAQAQKKWGDDLSLDDLFIHSENVHTNALGYDLYDPSDYTEYLCIVYVDKAKTDGK